MSRSRRPVSVLATGALILLLTVAVTPVAAASSSVECGQLSGYTAPDPLGPTDGSLQLGVLPAWVVLADATISPEAEAALPGAVNTGPTCLAIDFDDDGFVTAIGFASQGDIVGDVEFDAGSGFYMLADRLIIPETITDSIPGLGALFVTSYEAGSELSVTLSIDTMTGAIIGFDGTAAFCGAGSVTTDGDGQVGDAIIAGSLLDDDDLDALEGAGDRETCATIHSAGSIDTQGNIDVTTDVDIAVAAAEVTITPPPTSTASTSTSGTAVDDAIGWLAAMAVALWITMVLLTWRFRSTNRR